MGGLLSTFWSVRRHGCKMKLDPTVSGKIDAIDLTNAKLRLQDPKLGEGWTARQCDLIERKYKNFLKLISTGMIAVPSKDVDKLFHVHILDTKSYFQDTERCFGRYIHHMPYMKENDLGKAWKETCKRYQELFNEPYVNQQKVRKL